MSNVRPIIPPKREIPKVADIEETVIRAKQIVAAVNIAGEHGESRFDYALDQVFDMLEQVVRDLSILNDALERQNTLPSSEDAS